MDKAQERDFRRLVLYLADRLTDTETNKLVYIYDLPLEYKDKQLSVVLEVMHNWDLFSASKPEQLVKLMKEVKRVDLCKAIEKYVKKIRKAGTKSGATPHEPEADPSFISSLQAKLEVLSIQSSISAHVVDQFLEMVRPTTMQRMKEVVEEAKLHVDNFCWLTKSAKILLDIHPNLKRGQKLDHSLADQYPKERVAEWCGKGGSHYSYIDFDPGRSCSLSAAQMVTRHPSAHGARQDFPPALPKPRASAGARQSLGPRVIPPSIPQVAVSDQKSTLQRIGEEDTGSVSGHSQRSCSSSSAESDYTDGSSVVYTGGDATGTADSGFGEDFKAPLKGSELGWKLILKPAAEQLTGGVCCKTTDSSIAEGSSEDEEEDSVYENRVKVMKEVDYVNVSKREL